MDSFFNSFRTSNSEIPFHHDSPQKFSDFGSFTYYNVLKKDFQKGFLLDFDSNFGNQKKIRFNLKEGFSMSEKNSLSRKISRKFSLFFEQNNFLTAEAKISRFSMESLKFNLNSNFAFFKNLKIYSSLKPYHTKNYSLSKIGVRYYRKRICLDNRLEFDKSIDLGLKAIFFPNNFFFCGGLVKFGVFSYDVKNLSLILGVRKPEYEFIFRNESFYFPDERKVGLFVSQNLNENLSLAASYKFTTKQGCKEERNKLEFGFLYRNRPTSNFKMKIQNLSNLKTSIKIAIQEYLEITLCNNIFLQKKGVGLDYAKDAFGVRLKLNIV